VWGLIENSKEAFMVEQMSLEQAYNAFKRGELRTTLAIHAAKTSECECGNAAGTECFNSAHVAMRQEMNPPIKHDCQTCACVGCSEGNCCGGC
jgi:hypothetical protein